MPSDFTMILARELGADTANISRVVSLERTSSKYWPAIENLAMKTDPKACKERMRFLNAQGKGSGRGGGAQMNRALAAQA